VRLDRLEVPEVHDVAPVDAHELLGVEKLLELAEREAYQMPPRAGVERDVLTLRLVTKEDTAKLRDIGGDPHVNLAYYKDRTREWVSVSGMATMTRDRGKIHELYASDWKMWFPDEGDPRHGTKDDPRMVLIGVDVHAAVFLEMDKPQPVVLFELVKSWLTGAEPDLGEMHRIE
jgi:general stress protein 26